MDGEWTTVTYRKKKSNNKANQIPDSYYDDFDRDQDQADCQDWKPVVVHKKPEPPKKGSFTPGAYTTVSTGKTGQPSDYDPRKLAKIANETENFRIKHVDKATSVQIQQARQAKNLTQKELAQKMSVPLTIVSQWEAGTAVYDGSIIQKFKKFLDLN